MTKRGRIVALILGLVGIGAGAVFFLFIYAHTGMNETGEASLRAMFTESEYLPGALVASTIIILGVIVSISAVATHCRHASDGEEANQRIVPP